jgi:hypothetical protein
MKNIKVNKVINSNMKSMKIVISEKSMMKNKVWIKVTTTLDKNN